LAPLDQTDSEHDGSLVASAGLEGIVSHVGKFLPIAWLPVYDPKIAERRGETR
jgi:hypothetical protein